MDGEMDGCMERWKGSGPMDGWMNGQPERQMHGWIDVQMDGWKDGWGMQIDERTTRQTDAQLGGLTDKWMDGWMEGQAVGRQDAPFNSLITDLLW